MPRVRKRNGRVVEYDEGKVAHEILLACQAAGEGDPAVAAEFAQMVSFLLRRYHPETDGGVLDSDVVDEMIEKVLLQAAPAVAKSFLLRTQRRREREESAPRPARSAGYGQRRLFPDDTLFVVAESSTQSFPWDRQRIVDALIREADMAPTLAEQVAARVEKRVFAAGVKRVGSGVVRELIGAELFEQGMSRERDRHAVLGVPKFDLEAALLRGRPGDDAPAVFRDSRDVDEYLHEQVLRRFALQEIHSPEVTAAHTDGRLHVHGLGSPVRLVGVRVCPDGIKHGWPRRAPAEAGSANNGRAGARHRAADRVAAPATEEQFFVLLRRYAEELQHVATGTVTFAGFSLVLAPLAADLDDDARRGLLRRALGALSGNVAQRLRLEFPLAVPAEYRHAAVFGLGGVARDGVALGDLESVVRALARDAVRLLLDGQHQALLAPDLAIAVDAAALTRPEAHEVLEAAVDCAARHGAPRFVFPRPRPESLADVRDGSAAKGTGSGGAGDDWRQLRAPGSLPAEYEISVCGVALNLPQAAYRAGRGDHDAFAVECETLLTLARKAVHERVQFLLGSLARLSSPLLAVGRGSDEVLHPATLDLRRAHARLELVGLSEAMAYLAGDVEPAADDVRATRQEIQPVRSSDAATRGGLRAVSYLAFTLREQTSHSPIELRLAEAAVGARTGGSDDADVAERFRHIDARTYPSYVESLAARGFLLPGEPYSAGVRLPGSPDPLSVLTREARFHTLLAPGSEIVVPPQQPTHDVATLIEAVKQAVWHTGAHGLAFPVVALSCAACGECRSTPLASPAVCPACGHDRPEHGWLLGNRFAVPRD